MQGPSNLQLPYVSFETTAKNSPTLEKVGSSLQRYLFEYNNSIKLYVISCLENCILRKLDLSRLALLMNPVPNHYQLPFLYNFVQ